MVSQRKRETKNHGSECRPWFHWNRYDFNSSRRTRTRHSPTQTIKGERLAVNCREIHHHEYASLRRTFSPQNGQTISRFMGHVNRFSKIFSKQSSSGHPLSRAAPRHSIRWQPPGKTHSQYKKRSITTVRTEPSPLFLRAHTNAGKPYFSDSFRATFLRSMQREFYYVKHKSLYVSDCKFPLLEPFVLA